jgi:SAM-dependent methyltransferase
MEQYPETATEIFDNANFHIKYCLSIIKKYIKGDVIEIGAGCGSFTRSYYRPDLKNIVLTEKDLNNIQSLKNNFKKHTNIKVMHTSIDLVEGRFDSILYFHVLEHIEKDLEEIEMAKKKLNEGGHLIIMVPAHQKIYGNLDKAVGHFRRYEKDFFKKELLDLKLIDFKYVDILGYLLYSLNKFFYKKETFPSDLKIFLWDKIFTPLTIFIDFITRYNYGKCIIAVYKKK